MLQAGIKGIKEITVTQDKTAKAMGSGTVGTALNVRHVSASPVGMKIKCETELTKVDGRALTFLVKAYDEAGLIGEGEHERFIIFEEKFQKKADEKADKTGRA